MGKQYRKDGKNKEVGEINVTQGKVNSLNEVRKQDILCVLAKAISPHTDNSLCALREWV